YATLFRSSLAIRASIPASASTVDTGVPCNKHFPRGNCNTVAVLRTTSISPGKRDESCHRWRIGGPCNVAVGIKRAAQRPLQRPASVEAFIERFSFEKRLRGSAALLSAARLAHGISTTVTRRERQSSTPSAS